MKGILIYACLFLVTLQTASADDLCPCGVCERYCCPCPTPFRGTSCFPEDVHLLLDNGKFVQMKNLTAGDMILTVQDGRRVFSKVRTFLNRQPYKEGRYRTLITDKGNQVTMSGSHIIFASSNNKSTSMESRFAGSIKPGDYIFSTQSCPYGLCPERVINVSTSIKKGIYVPLTDAGTLVVDGIFASSYGSIQHDVAHLFMTPFRWFPWLLNPWQQDGYSPIIPSLVSVGRMFLPEGFASSHNEL